MLHFELSSALSLHYCNMSADNLSFYSFHYPFQIAKLSCYNLVYFVAELPTFDTFKGFIIEMDCIWEYGLLPGGICTEEPVILVV